VLCRSTAGPQPARSRRITTRRHAIFLRTRMAVPRGLIVGGFDRV
jgi:hypothetical protein